MKELRFALKMDWVKQRFYRERIWAIVQQIFEALF